MSIIYILIPIAMILVTFAIIVFFWAVKSNQYEDLDREGINILFDEDLQAPAIKEDSEDLQKKTKPGDLND
ncbi:cbb3-type cytochrome oxidase assembly protein CcoS [Psychromonas sp. MB-3u-54]|uniref:cbb3-type cytochrome oxidase assembly protein CcoS n=1 Tax=Psychromonas sp. MB-3u-54 TaxID=2058319 RepID=UPI000C33CAD0|nr:cbb3-type cytochrome oxidase assembly protein CcoS [Psychromonas sp. MB-3u-54]PKH04123.1 cbb3-type cytochrome oxidase assembly protein CcoS [Psychromonas sp. MB-3u-54]